MKSLKHWQDPINGLLGVWLALSPWVLGFSAETVAMGNAALIGVALIAVALGAMIFPRAWEEWTEAVLGLWLIASPWVLGFSGLADARNAMVVSGAVVTVLALWTLATDKDYSAWLRDKVAH